MCGEGKLSFRTLFVKRFEEIEVKILGGEGVDIADQNTDLARLDGTVSFDLLEIVSHLQCSVADARFCLHVYTVAVIECFGNKRARDIQFFCDIVDGDPFAHMYPPVCRFLHYYYTRFFQNRKEDLFQQNGLSLKLVTFLHRRDGFSEEMNEKSGFGIVIGGGVWYNVGSKKTLRFCVR